jgi:phosphatidate phosphatase APP1
VSGDFVSTEPAPSIGRPARIDYAISRWRARRARNAGYRATVIAYTGYGSTGWVRVLGRVLLTRDQQGHTQREEPTGARGWHSFTSVPVELAEVEIEVEGRRHAVRADRSGIVDARIAVALDPGWHTLTMSSEGSPPASAQVFVIAEDERYGIVSDVDDTVMVTALPRPLLAAWHTFVVNEHARATTPGMPVLYERLLSRHRSSPMVYLSTGPWNVAPTLARFLSRNLYPAGPLLLTDWGPTADRWFRSGEAHKRSALERLATEFPQIRWILIGDDGQHDESIYEDFVARHPDRVTAVCIRQLTPGEAVLAGSSLKSRSPGRISSVPWVYASDGAGLAARLESLGLLPARARQPE